jgi:RNA polymerase sigma-70 factor, ECF subfamily
MPPWRICAGKEKRPFFPGDASVQDGNRLTEDEAAEVIHLVRTKVRKLVGIRRADSADGEDLEQDLLLAVLTRLPGFDSSRANLRTYVDRIIDTARIDQLRARYAAKRNPSREEGSLDDVVLHEGTAYRRSDLVDAESQQFAFGRRRRSQSRLEDLRIDVNQALADMPACDHDVCEEAKTNGPVEAARNLGLSRGTIRRRLDRVRERLRDLRLDEYLD